MTCVARHIPDLGLGNRISYFVGLLISFQKRRLSERFLTRFICTEKSEVRYPGQVFSSTGDGNIVTYAGRSMSRSVSPKGHHL